MSTIGCCGWRGTSSSRAQIAALAVEIPHESIMEGINSAIMYRRKHRKTKAEWNSERVRDFRVCKDQGDNKAKAAAEADERELQDEVDGMGQEDTAARFSVDADPNPHLRFYDYSSYTQGMRQINAKDASVGAIRVLDLAGQLIGDDRLADVCYGLRRNPLRVLNLSDNLLTDQGMQYLQGVAILERPQRPFLSHNDITDTGIETIFGAKVFPPQLRKVDLSFNGLGPKAAYTLGRMFQGDRSSHLDSLYLGGKKNKRGWGDEFVRILVDFDSSPCKAAQAPLHPQCWPDCRGHLRHRSVSGVRPGDGVPQHYPEFLAGDRVTPLLKRCTT